MSQTPSPQELPPLQLQVGKILVSLFFSIMLFTALCVKTKTPTVDVHTNRGERIQYSERKHFHLGLSGCDDIRQRSSHEINPKKLSVQFRCAEGIMKSAQKEAYAFACIPGPVTREADGTTTNAGTRTATINTHDVTSASSDAADDANIDSDDSDRTVCPNPRPRPHRRPLQEEPKPTSEKIEVFVKWAVGRQECNVLNKEANVYMENLHALQGLVVPRFLGFYTCKVDGEMVGVSVFQYVMISYKHYKIKP